MYLLDCRNCGPNDHYDVIKSMRCDVPPGRTDTIKCQVCGTEYIAHVKDGDDGYDD